MDTLPAVLLLVTALLLGLVHGMDWDHIAAITDITGTMDHPRRGFFLATMYALGHATVVLTLGIAAVVLGLQLPEWVDGSMQHVVGATLIFLAIYIIWSLFRYGEEFRMRSRWMLLLDGARTMLRWLTGKLTGVRDEHVVIESSYGVRTAFGIGMLHGIGAETPTQVLLFVTAAGAGGALLGSLVVLVFACGLVITNSLIAVLSIFGFAGARRRRRVWMGAGAVTAVFSLAVGTTFLLGQSGILPPFPTIG